MRRNSLERRDLGNNEFLLRSKAYTYKHNSEALDKDRRYFKKNNQSAVEIMKDKVREKIEARTTQADTNGEIKDFDESPISITLRIVCPITTCQKEVFENEDQVKEHLD